MRDMQPNPKNDLNRICVGIIVGAHGVRGILRVKSLTDIPHRFDAGQKLYLQQKSEEQRAGIVLPNGFVFMPPQMLCIENSSVHKDVLLVQTKEITQRESAMALRGYQLQITMEQSQQDSALRSHQNMADPDTFFYYQLVGLDVIFQGNKFGLVTNVQHFGATEILTITALDNKEYLLPFTRENVPVVNIEQGFLEITPIEGLLDQQ